MGEISSDSTIVDVVPQLGRKIITVETPTTADTGDTIDITLADFGVSTFLGINGYAHSTENEVVITEDPTTTFTGGVLTIIIGGSLNTDNKRVYVIYAK